jgi:dynein heavy chain
LVARYEQWDRWLKQGRPKVFWLTGFFNPQGFITAMRQEISRRHAGWALDDVVVYNTVTKMEAEDVKDSPPEGIYIQGLFLDGCAWSKKENKLVDSAPKQLFAPLPVLHLNGVLKTNDKYDYAVYVCPLYISKKRSDALLVLPLKLRIVRTLHARILVRIETTHILCRRTSHLNGSFEEYACCARKINTPTFRHSRSFDKVLDLNKTTIDNKNYR